jgi:adenylate cyclase
VAGYSRLMTDDEAATIRAITDYREEISMLVRQHRGRVVDAPGDNLLAEFPTASDTVRGAVEIQRVIGVRNADLPVERRMEFRIGVYLGDVAVEGDRIYGDGVNSRLYTDSFVSEVERLQRQAGDAARQVDASDRSHSPEE